MQNGSVVIEIISASPVYSFSVCCEQWIHAKYERKEFVDGDEAACVRQPP